MFDILNAAWSLVQYWYLIVGGLGLFILFWVERVGGKPVRSTILFIGAVLCILIAAVLAVMKAQNETKNARAETKQLKARLDSLTKSDYRFEPLGSLMHNPPNANSFFLLKLRVTNAGMSASIDPNSWELSITFDKKTYDGHAVQFGSEGTEIQLAPDRKLRYSYKEYLYAELAKPLPSNTIVDGVLAFDFSDLPRDLMSKLSDEDTGLVTLTASDSRGNPIRWETSLKKLNRIQNTGFMIK